MSKERLIEALVVADSSMYNYYKNEDLENYLLTVMNMVNSLYSRVSLENSIKIVVVRMLILEDKEVHKIEYEISLNSIIQLLLFLNFFKAIRKGHEWHAFIGIILQIPESHQYPRVASKSP